MLTGFLFNGYPWYFWCPGHTLIVCLLAKVTPLLMSVSGPCPEVDAAAFDGKQHLSNAENELPNSILL